jgi:hypothetical protein
MINQLVEKYLTGFKKYGHMVDVFENPSKKEMAEIGTGTFRFILDSKRQKIYVWSAMGSVHTDAWINIKKQLNDSRPLYKSSTIIPGTFENNSVYIYGAKGIPRAISAQYQYEDWDFAKKWIPLDKLLYLIQ